MISLQHALALTSPLPSPPPAVTSKPSRSPTPSADPTIDGQQDPLHTPPIDISTSYEYLPALEVDSGAGGAFPSGSVVLNMDPSTSPSIPLDRTLHATISISEAVKLFRKKTHQQDRCRKWNARLQLAQKSAALSPRLIRIGELARKILVEYFKYGDKANFISVYNTIHELRDMYNTWSATFPQDGSRFGVLGPEDLPVNDSSSLIDQLSPSSKDDMLEYLRLVRTSPDFLADRIRSLSSAQLLALTSSTHLSHVSESVFPSQSRGRSQASASRRSSVPIPGASDRLLDFERNDSLSLLLFDVFDLTHGSECSDSSLRLDVWASTCAKLLAGSGASYYRFISDLTSTWAATREWLVKPKLELYLMDILEKGAFLLERIEDPLVTFHRPNEVIDPMSTEVAEEFFAKAVQDLFDVLDGPHGGMPQGALEFCNSILFKIEDTIQSKVEATECQARFKDSFIYWFFTKHLAKALIYPEDEGMLFGFHVKKEARSLLHKVASRALHAAVQFFPQRNHPAITEETRAHIESMLSHIRPASKSRPRGELSQNPAETRENKLHPLLVLSASDLHTLLNALVPEFDHGQFPWEQNSIRSSSSSLFSVPFRSDISQPASRPRSLFDSSNSHATHPSVMAGHQQTFGSFNPSSQQLQEEPSTSRNTSPFQNLIRRLEVTRRELYGSLCGRVSDNAGHPFAEDWTVFFCSQINDTVIDAGKTETASDLGYISFASAEIQGSSPDEDDKKRLKAAIINLLADSDEFEEILYARDLDGDMELHLSSLDLLFKEAAEHCLSQSDFFQAHSWWDARTLLHRMYPSLTVNLGEIDILRDLLQSSQDSVQQSLKMIQSHKESFDRLQRSLSLSGSLLKETFQELTKLRDKMWYMTDVKHSSRYEEARNVAVALKTMGYPASARRSHSSSGSRRNYAGSSRSSVIQTPEAQTIELMKTTNEQGGPNKLADDQVERTRRWLKRSGIENFCHGEERIHRFCLEIKTCVNMLVGETMVEGPVLWSSDLYYQERVLFDSHPTRAPSVRNAVRPSSITSEEHLFAMPQSFPASRGSEVSARTPYNSYLSPSSKIASASLMCSFGPSDKVSSPSLITDRWKIARDKDNLDNSSIDESPGKAVSTSTVESYNTYSSPLPPKMRSSTSISSFRSRPSSLYNEQTSLYNEQVGFKGADRQSNQKSNFLLDLRQTLTGLLLSDLGFPVWSIGSETDAWFSDILERERVRLQTEATSEPVVNVTVRRGSTRSLNDLLRDSPESNLNAPERQRSHSAQPGERQVDWMVDQSPSPLSAEAEPNPPSPPEPPAFSYKDAFRHLLEKFSRHSNPYVKLKALHELRLLVLASLSVKEPSTAISQAGNEVPQSRKDEQSPHTPESRIGMSFMDQLSPQSSIHPPLLPPFESPVAPVPHLPSKSTSNPIVTTLQDLFRECAPKTLFRDLQFIAAFVPLDILNKTDSGKAFLDAGVAALALKQDVCQIMVEMADSIVAQYVDRRNPTSEAPGRSHSMADAVRLWIITAKEGNPVAQRELAILYLTDPDLIPRVTLPMTLPRETFKAELMYRRNEDMNKADPQALCLALHWMQHSAQGGDELAKHNMRDREEFEGIP